jgi:HEAT repeat protein
LDDITAKTKSIRQEEKTTPRGVIRAVLRLVVISLLLLVLWSSPGWAQSTPASTPNKVIPLVETLTGSDVRLRREAADALVNMGAGAVPTLADALNNPEQVLRWRVASVLGDIGADAAAAVPALTKALKDPDEQVRLYATLALGDVGPAAKSAIPALIDALKDSDLYVRIYTPTALRKIGADAKLAIPALIEALGDANARVRLNAVYALGTMGTDAAPAFPQLIKVLQQDPRPYVRFGALKSLGDIAIDFAAKAQGLSSTKINTAIANFETALQDSQTDATLFPESDLERIRQPLSKLKVEAETRVLDRAIAWLLHHPWVLGALAYLSLLPTMGWLFLRLAPLWLLKLNDVLKPYTDISLPVVGINVPLRSVLFLGWFHYHPRVLDAWVAQYLEHAAIAFANKATVRSRADFVPVPVVLDGKTIPELNVEQLQPAFAKQRSCLVIWGEGGVGKTSLACQIAKWGMAKAPRSAPQQLCAHPILPVLLEEDLRPVEGKSALLEAIRGQLQALIDKPEPIDQELLMQLLRKQRVLVIIDHLSELTPATRDAIQPESPDFPINALIVTSRLEESLGQVNKTVLKPLRIEGNKLSSFMEAYLTQRSQRHHFTDQQFFAACSRLSLMVGQRQITVLLAKLYAEQLIAKVTRPSTDVSDTLLPDTIPNLVLGYLNELNRDITGDKLDDRMIHQDAKAIAWECLKQTYQPATAKRADVLAALTEVDNQTAASRLDYLEDRLHLVQTIGSAKDQLQFSLDPLAEYLAGLHLVDLCGKDNRRWRSIGLKPAEELMKAGQQENIQGFLMALRECYLSQIPAAQESDFVPQQLGKLVNVESLSGSPAPVLSDVVKVD